MTITEVNGLYPTRTRRALLHAIAKDRDRVYFEAGEVWDKALGIKVTAKVRDLIRHQWIRAQTPDEPRVRPQLPTRTYYVVLEAGHIVLNQEAAR